MKMLVLTRKTEEKIVIGKKNQIIITILKIQGDKVSIGIEADKETPIYRFELLLKDLEKINQKSLVDQETMAPREVAKNLQLEIKNKSDVLEKETVEVTRDS
jgi:carbon storage regulator CsrA